MSRNSYAVFGLGSFGSKLALELSKAGHNVLVCDVNQSKVDDFCSKVAEAVVCDVSYPETVR
ncbi:MAG: NAD-binding protein [Lentisphaeria bacterium]|nr:NAD-binding protein [Lentisphaeria bacterium]